MRHINKNNPKIRKEALTIILKLIQNQWIDGEYYNLTYEDLDVSELENILVKEQEGYCCYCMRTLRQSEIDGSERNVTLEHIIQIIFPNLILKETKQDILTISNLTRNTSKSLFMEYWKTKRNNLNHLPFHIL